MIEPTNLSASSCFWIPARLDGVIRRASQGRDLRLWQAAWTTPAAGQIFVNLCILTEQAKLSPGLASKLKQVTKTGPHFDKVGFEGYPGRRRPLGLLGLVAQEVSRACFPMKLRQYLVCMMVLMKLSSANILLGE